MAVRSSGTSRAQPRVLEESSLGSRVLRDTEMAAPLSGEPRRNKESGKDREKCHEDVEDVTSTDCVAAKDEEGRGVSVLHTRHRHLSGEIKSYHKMRR